MIFDDFKKCGHYAASIPFLKEIADFVNGRDCSLIPDGEIEILGRDLFVRTAEYLTGPSEQKKFEAHKVYADLQLVVKGEERMDVSVFDGAKACTPYDTAADIHFFEPVQEYSQVRVGAGQFTFFIPGELHKPGCQTGPSAETVKKLVFKIRMGKI